MACPRCDFWALENGASECSACAAAKRLVWWASHRQLAICQQQEVVAILHEASCSIAGLVGKASFIIAGEDSRARERTGVGPELSSDDDTIVYQEAGSGDQHGGRGHSGSARSRSHGARSKSCANPEGSAQRLFSPTDISVRPIFPPSPPSPRGPGEGQARFLERGYQYVARGGCPGVAHAPLRAADGGTGHSGSARTSSHRVR
jgi:hypothetical protein